MSGPSPEGFYDAAYIREHWPGVEASAQRIAAVIDTALPPGFGFALLLFSFGAGGFITHVSNAARDDLARTLRELADAIEENADSPPGVVGQAD